MDKQHATGDGNIMLSISISIFCRPYITLIWFIDSIQSLHVSCVYIYLYILLIFFNKWADLPTSEGWNFHIAFTG